jgi:hypothetical protein
MPVLSTVRQLLLAATRGDKKVQWALGPTIRQTYVQRLLAPLGRLLCNRLPGSGRHRVLKSGAAQSNPTKRSKLWTNPVVWRSGMPNKTFSPSQDLLHNALPGNGQACLNSRITELLLPTPLATSRRRPNHLRVKSDRQRSAPLQAVIVRRPILGLVLRRGPTAHTLSYHAGFIQ